MIKFLDLTIDNNFERDKLIEVFNSYLDSGRFIIKDEPSNFEKKFAKIINRKLCVGVNTGTDALVLALRLLNLPKGCNIITSPFSWIASASSIKLAGFNPIFIDVDKFLQLDLNKVEKYLGKFGDSIKAILIPHLNGNVTNLEKLRFLKSKFNLKIIEDCAQAFSAFDENNLIAGSLGDISAFSFNPMKVLGGLGDGGAIVFDNEEFLSRAYSLRHSGMCSLDGEVMKELSGNFRIDSIHASFLEVRLDFYKERIKIKRELASLYIKNLNKSIVPIIQDIDKSNLYCFQVLLPKRRNELIDFLTRKNIEVRVRHDFLINDLDLFSNSISPNITNAKKFVKNILCLPLHHQLTNDDVLTVVELINQFYEKNYHLDY